MKKIVFALLACSISALAMATQTAAFNITLKSATGTTDILALYENDSYTNAYENGIDAEKMMSFANNYSVLIYGIVETYNCSTVGALNLDGMYVGFTTNNVDNNYTLIFSDFAPGSREVKLYDAVADSVITINGSTPAYAFTATAGRVAVTDRFVFGVPAPVTPEICHRDGKLQVTGMKGTNVVVKNMDDSATSIGTVAITNKYQEIDLSGLTAGQYKVDYNDGTAHTVIIKVVAVP